MEGANLHIKYFNFFIMLGCWVMVVGGIAEKINKDFVILYTYLEMCIRCM